MVFLGHADEEAPVLVDAYQYLVIHHEGEAAEHLDGSGGHVCWHQSGYTVEELGLKGRDHGGSDQGANNTVNLIKMMGWHADAPVVFFDETSMDKGGDGLLVEGYKAVSGDPVD